jgi:hypothetical protein
MKVKELKKLLANADDELEVFASVSVDDMTYSGQISSGSLGRIDDESNIFDDDGDEEYKDLPLIFELYAFYGD